MRKKLLRILIILVACIITGYALLTLAYCIPVSKMSENVYKSCEVFREEGINPILVDGYIGTRLDNYSDGLIINTAICEGTGNPFIDAAANYQYIYDSKLYMDSLLEYCDGNNDYKIESYARDWHGYLIFVKPLLCFTDYDGYRIINLVFQIGLVSLIVVQMMRIGMKRYIPILFGTLVFLSAGIIHMSIEYSQIYSLTLCASCFVLTFYKRLIQKDLLDETFLIIGVLTSFLDLLTYPILSLCIPLTLTCLLTISDKDHELTIKEFIKLIVIWGVGYIGMWSGKWIIATIVTGDNIIKEAILKILYRASSVSDDSGTRVSFTVFDVLTLNFGVYAHWIYVVLIGMVIAFSSYLRYVKGYRSIIELNRKIGVELLLIMAIPVVWYIVIGNHSFVHFWMTHRSIAGSFFALGCLLVGGKRRATK